MARGQLASINRIQRWATSHVIFSSFYAALRLAPVQGRRRQGTREKERKACNVPDADYIRRVSVIDPCVSLLGKGCGLVQGGKKEKSK